MNYQTPNKNFNEMIVRCLSRLKPPERLNLSDYADRYRVLSSEDSSEPGKWSTDRMPFQREIMNELTNPLNETVSWMAASQLGKTQICNNFVMYSIDYDPSPILYVHFSEKMGKAWSKDRFRPMVRDNKKLLDILGDPGKKKKDQELLHYTFPGGHLTAVGSNQPADLASRPIRKLILDEVDRYKSSSGSEGDAIKLAVARTKTFTDRIIFIVSSPSIKGSSKIQTAYEEGDQRQYYVPCPECGEMQTLEWEQLKFPNKDASVIYYECLHCKAKIPESKKLEMLRNGKWIAGKPERENKPSFWINELYSPMSSWVSMVANFLEAKRLADAGDTKQLQVFVNTSLARLWEDTYGTLDPTGYLERVEDYTADAIPNDVVIITAAVDVQDDRLEFVSRGWNRHEESWRLEHKVIVGNPALSDVWNQLSNILRKKYKRQDGIELPISIKLIDSGGHYTDEVYTFVKTRIAERVYAIKGSGTPGKAINPLRPSLNNKGKIPLYHLGVNSAKDVIYKRLQIEHYGAGYLHFDKTTDLEYFKQLTAEKKEEYTSGGVRLKRWVQIRGRRNEALDLEVYNLAALRIRNPNWDSYEKHIEIEKEKIKNPDKDKVINKNKIKNRRNFVNSWRQ